MKWNEGVNERMTTDTGKLEKKIYSTDSIDQFLHKASQYVTCNS